MSNGTTHYKSTCSIARLVTIVLTRGYNSLFLLSFSSSQTVSLPESTSEKRCSFIFSTSSAASCAPLDPSPLAPSLANGPTSPWFLWEFLWKFRISVGFPRNFGISMEFPWKFRHIYRISVEFLGD